MEIGLAMYRISLGDFSNFSKIINISEKANFLINVLFLISSFTIMIIMMNLLIAIITGTYETVKKNE